MYRLILLTLISFGTAHDITVGTNTEGKIIFNDSFQASPAIWRQKQNITINTTNDEVISRIVVTDLREEKDGSAKIVDGGEGHKTVTLELQSPTVLRGYDFHVEVYAVPDKHQHPKTNGDVPAHPRQIADQNKEDKNKRSSDVNATPPRPNSEASTSSPTTTSTKAVSGLVSTSTVLPDSTRQTRDTENKGHDESKEKNHPLLGSQNKKFEVLDKEENHSNNQTTSSPRTLTEDKKTSANKDEKVLTPTLLLGNKPHSEDARQTRDTQHQDTMKQNQPRLEDTESKMTTTTTNTPFVALNAQSTPPNNPPAKEVLGKVKREENVTPTIYNTHRPNVYTPAVNGQNIPYNIAKESNTPTTEANKNIEDRKNTANADKDSDEDEEDKLRAIPITMTQMRSRRDTHNQDKSNTPRLLTDVITNPPKTTNQNSENITEDPKTNSQNVQNGNANIPSFFGRRNFQQSSTTVSNGPSSTTERQNTGNISKTNVFPRTQNYPVPYPYPSTSTVSTTTKAQQKRDTETSTVDSKRDENDGDLKIAPESFGVHVRNATRQSSDKVPVISIQ